MNGELKQIYPPFAARHIGKTHKPTPKPNFAKEPFRPSLSYFRLKELLAIQLNMNE